MTRIAINPNDSTARMISNACGYRGRTLYVEAREKVTLSDTAWDGGSRSVYHAVRLSDGMHLGLPKFNPPQFGGPREDPEVPVPPDSCIVEHVIFRGKDMGLRIYVNPANMAALLPAPVALTPEERAVLIATKHYKSSYNGQSRREMYNADYRGQGIHLTQAVWDAAKATLIGKGLLDKRGAITVDGRNAVAA